MFSGLVADLGRLKEISTGSEGARLAIETSLASRIETGDSIAVNGTCLTATTVEQRQVRSFVQARVTSLAGAAT